MPGRGQRPADGGADLAVAARSGDERGGGDGGRIGHSAGHCPEGEGGCASRAATDEDLLGATDALSFEEFYLRHVDTVLGYFARRTGDAELAADLASETFAAALAGRRRYKPRKGAAGAWLFGIASRKLADAQRRGYAERRMCRRLGMERIELTDADIAHIEALGEGALLEGCRRRSATPCGRT